MKVCLIIFLATPYLPCQSKPDPGIADHLTHLEKVRLDGQNFELLTE